MTAMFLDFESIITSWNHLCFFSRKKDPCLTVRGYLDFKHSLVTFLLPLAFDKAIDAFIACRG